MNNFKKILFIILLLGTQVAQAYTPSEGKVTALGGPLLFKTNYDADTPGLHSPMLGGIGLIAEGDLDDHGGLEISMFYMRKQYFRQMDGKYVAERAKALYVTMGYRRWFSSRFSGAIALFSSYSMGDPRVIYSDFTPAATPNTSARDTTEYGFDFSLQWEILNFNKYAVVLDTRYSLSVTEKDHEDSDHYGALLGLRYQIQEKYEK